MDFQSVAAIGRRRRGAALVAMMVPLALLVPLLTAGPAPAATVQLWHAMSGELGRQLGQLAAGFNASQSEHRVVPEYKGNYTETVTAAIFAVRTKKQPAIVQVNEIATATMMAAKGAIYPAFELMRAQGVPFDQEAYLPAVSGYYSDLAGNLLSFPFNASTPILYYNRDAFRAAGLDENVAPKTWPEVEAAARKLRQSNIPCGFTTHWPSWVNVENFSAWHNVPIATHANGLAGFGAELTIDNPTMVRHLEALVEWQKTKLYDYSGRASAAEPRFPAGECGMFLGSSAQRADILAKSRFSVGYGMLPYWPDVAGAPRTRSSAGRPYGCCAAGPRRNTPRWRNSSLICRSRRSRRCGTRTPVTCRSPGRPTSSRARSVSTRTRPARRSASSRSRSIRQPTPRAGCGSAPSC